jgi:two-component system phosphate regulon response regulator PhoB
MAKLLLVDDEPDLLGPLVYALEREGHEVTTCATGEEALLALSRSTWDLLLLDLMLPDVSGTTICRRVRADPATAALPVIIVSARADAYDRVVGFEIGADDYVTKPYHLRELLLRVGALLRRAQGDDNPLLRSGDVVVDRVAHRCEVAGEEIPLTVLELRLLVAFLEQPGRALTRAELRDLAWGEAYRVGERAVDTNIKRLRRKLGAASDPLETVRGVGYRWSEVAGS